MCKGKEMGQGSKLASLQIHNNSTWKAVYMQEKLNDSAKP
jgi:hypothetical protein